MVGMVAILVAIVSVSNENQINASGVLLFRQQRFAREEGFA